MGGDRTNRMVWSREAIGCLVADYVSHGRGLYSPITRDICKNRVCWHCSLTYNIDKDGCNYFFFLLEEPHYSLHSGIMLGEESFSYSSAYRPWKGWKKYTPDELKQHVWAASRIYAMTSETKQQISTSLAQYYQDTEDGMNIRIKKSKALQEYWKTDEGRIDAKKEQRNRASR